MEIVLVMHENCDVKHHNFIVRFTCSFVNLVYVVLLTSENILLFFVSFH